LSAGAQLAYRPPRAEGCFLYGVFGLIGVIQYRGRQAVADRNVRLDQSLKGSLIASPRSSEELLIAT